MDNTAGRNKYRQLERKYGNCKEYYSSKSLKQGMFLNIKHWERLEKLEQMEKEQERSNNIKYSGHQYW